MSLERYIQGQQKQNLETVKIFSFIEQEEQVIMNKVKVIWVS